MQLQHDAWEGSRRALLSAAGRFTVGGTLAAVLGGSAVKVALGQGTPGAMLPYPVFDVTTSDKGFQASSSIPAGRYLVTLHNTGSQDNAAHFIQPPTGSTTDQLIKTMHSMIAAAFATPVGGGTPAANAGSGGPPLIFNQMHWFGGVDDTTSGRTAQAIVDLAPGDYALFNPNYAGSPADVFSRLTVTAGTPAASTPTPVADTSIEEREYSYAGIPATIAPGRHIWKVTNVGETPHEMYVAKAPDGTTLDQVKQGLTEEGTPAPGQFDMSKLVSIGGVGGLSPKQTGWGVFDFAAGTYVAFCYFPAPGTGMPHALMGMVAVFTVGG